MTDRIRNFDDPDETVETVVRPPEEEDTLHPEPATRLAEGDTSIVSVEEIRSALAAQEEADAGEDEPQASLGQRILAALLILALAALIVVLVVKGLAR